MRSTASWFRMRLKIRHTRAFGKPLLSAIALLGGIALVGTASLLANEWGLSAFQPSIKNGGRANTFAPHPTSSKTILVASETGGLFRSDDGGEKWHHVDSLPVFATSAVAYIDSKTVLVTSLEDFKRSNGGGVWRSKDGGTTWSHMPGPPARRAAQAARLSAYEISIAPDTHKIYVATSFGCSMSSDKGETWTHSSVFSGGVQQVLSVVALGKKVVLAGGPAGLRRSTDGGASWFWPISGIGSVNDIHAFGRSPVFGAQAYAVNGSTQLYYTENGGNSWKSIGSAPPAGGACGGIAFVKPVRSVSDPDGLDLYFGNRCGVTRLVCPRDWTTEKNRFDYTGSWEDLNSDHADTRDLLLKASTPILLATDGGLHKTTDGGNNWTFVGGGKDGYNALQITEVQGQQIDDVGRHDLYFGTQDNDLWSSSDGGKTWVSGGWGEGFFIEAARRMPTESASKITFVACGPCGNVVSGALFSSPGVWPDAQVDASGNPVGSPKLVRPPIHIQGLVDKAPFSSGMALTTNTGGKWEQWASFSEPQRDLPKVSDPGTFPVLYQAIQTGYDFAKDFEIDRLARIVPQILKPGAGVLNPAMNNFGGLGINPTMFAWYQVFGVDPGNFFHLIAPDVVSERMMESWDGGDNWSEIPQLTSLVTGGGTFLFRRGIFPHASVVSFCPDSPGIVAVGTVEGGIFISEDGGATWDKVADSDRATAITSFHWTKASQAVVSTYGRGLWLLNCPQARPPDEFWEVGGMVDLVKCKIAALEGLVPKHFPVSDFARFCKGPCSIRAFARWRGDSVDKFSRAVLVFNGRIMGVRSSEGVLRHLYVSPGSSVGFASDSEEPFQIQVTEAARTVGFEKSSGVPRAPKSGWIIKGLTLGEHGELRGAIFGDRPMPVIQLDEPPKKSEQQARSVERPSSPTVGKPHVRLISGGLGAANRVSPGQAMRIIGSGFKPGARVEIALDGRPVETEASVGPKGEFSATIAAPREFGLHRLTVRQGGNTDGIMFLVSHVDEHHGRIQKESASSRD